MSDEEVSGLALLAYIGVLVAGYLTVMNVSLISFIVGAILIPLAFAVGIVYADGIIKKASEWTDRAGEWLADKWHNFREMDDELEEEEEDYSMPFDELQDSYDSTFDAQQGTAEIISAKVDPEQEGVLVIDFMTASGNTYATEVEIPPQGEWNRDHELPVLCSYMDVFPVWNYGELAESDKQVPIEQTNREEKPFEIDYYEIRQELTDESLVEEAAEKEHTNLEAALQVE